ncbi:hypothetical protein C5167_007903 [Papaver somniferum]|nr:hypothetical protein C5167_007903 [Papaver somniferum]
MEESSSLSIIDSVGDRISNLAEALIHHILSFLDMWRNVWRSVSNLVFSGDAFGERGVEQLKKLRKFVDKTDEILHEYLNGWILVALNCNVQDLCIHIEGDEDSEDDLEMSSFFVEDGDSLNILISSCPILQSLILRDIWIEDGYDMVVNIESNELKHLGIINNIDKLVCYHYNMANVIRLSTPNLTSFICEDYMIQEYFLDNVSSLITADTKILREGEYSSFRYYDLKISEAEKDILYPKRMMEFIGAFQNITELQFHHLDSFRSKCELNGMFTNLRNGNARL